MYTITKEIYFCYGHRLMEHPGKCRYLHGHSVKASITIAAERLNSQGMVCDFAEVSLAASAYIDRELDHNLLLHCADPLIPLLEQAGERFLPLHEHPTAEYLAQLIHQHMRKQGFAVQSVALWETSSACATYADF